MMTTSGSKIDSTPAIAASAVEIAFAPPTLLTAIAIEMEAGIATLRRSRETSWNELRRILLGGASVDAGRAIELATALGIDPRALQSLAYAAGRLANAESIQQAADEHAKAVARSRSAVDEATQHVRVGIAKVDEQRNAARMAVGIGRMSHEERVSTNCRLDEEELRLNDAVASARASAAVVEHAGGAVADAVAELDRLRRAYPYLTDCKQLPPFVEPRENAWVPLTGHPVASGGTHVHP